MAKNELAIMDKFEITTGYEDMDPELLEEIQDELGDLDEERGIACRKIKIPHGGIAFEVEGDDPDDAEPMKTVQGVIIFTHRMNSYWEKSPDEVDDDAGSKAPDCSSFDAKTGVEFETGEIKNCDTCPLNQFGAAGEGKPCKNIRRIYLLLSGRPVPYLLSIPPTSIRQVNKQMARIMSTTKMPYTRLVVEFKLEKAANKKGIVYSTVSVSLAGKLTPEQASRTAAMRKELKEKYKEVAITRDDYDTGRTETGEPAPVVDENGFMEAPADELPFV